MLKSKWFHYSLIIILFFLFINGVRILWINQLQPSIKDVNQTVPGELNFSEIKSDIIPLKGDWSFYPEQLLTAEQIKQKDFSSIKESKQYPQDWLTLSESNEYTYGTFHMRVHLNDELNNKSLSMVVPFTRLSSQLYVDEEAIGSSGTPSDNQKEFLASISPYTAEFIPKGKKVDVILHVANNGLTPYVPKEEILFGKTKSINEQISVSKLSKVSFLIFVLLLSIIALYLYYRLKKEKSLLYFSFVMFMLMMMVLFDYDQILLLVLPVEYQVQVKLLRLTYIFLSLFLFLFIKHFLPTNQKTKWYNFYPYVNILYAAFVIFLPLHIIFQFGSFLAFINIFPAIYFIHKLYLAKNTLENFMLLFLSGISSLNNIIWAILKSNVNGIHFNFYPIDLLLAILLFIFIGWKYI